jgi:transposase
MKVAKPIIPSGGSLMLRVTFCQLSMAAVDPDSIELETTAFERHLPELLPRLVPIEELRAMFPSEEGAPTSCALQLMAMLLLQFRYDLSERELYRRCIRDLGFRYALGLEAGAKPPSTRTLRRFRRRMTEAKGDDFLLHLSLRLVREEHLIDDAALQAQDSTNTNCRGAVIDTYNLVAAGIRQVVRQVARCLGVRPHEMARRWELSRYMARSIKGTAAIDWSDEDQRNALLTEEIADADRVKVKVDDLAQRVTLPNEVVEATQLLAQVARQDVEQLDDGTFRIARGTAKGRIISVTDPEARHGHKSQSKLIHGFKTHAMATIESQFVTGIAITDAATHDAPTLAATHQASRSPTT